MSESQEPEGIGFFNIKSGDTHYARIEPTIAAYINSSDMGINASRGQDFGWRLDPEWVKRVKAFRRDAMQMSILTSRNDGQKPNTVQILYHLYGEQLRAYQEELEEHEAPFEEEYLSKISSKTDVSEEVDEDSVAEAATSDTPQEPPKAPATAKKK